VLGNDLVTLNAFSMGAWSSGLNIAQAMLRNGLVKSIGPDLEKIIDTLRVLGPEFTYVIAGYPPFLREVLDYGETAGIDWARYRMFGVVGGEGMSEQLRDRLLTRFVAVYSTYGASDLDVGVGAETPLSIWVRRQADAIPELRNALFGGDPRLPMVFQYNPLDHSVEVIDGELVITVTRLSMLSPRIRYNIHDAGGAYSFDQVMSACRRLGLQPPLGRDSQGRLPLRLPFMYVQGRSDSTISYMGANIYPEDIEQALFADSALADRIGAFALELREIGEGAVRPSLHIELLVHAGDDEDVKRKVRDAVVARLEQNSRDFKAAVAENPTTADFVIDLHDPGTGPFAENSKRIKRRYIIPN
jgi:phenylacetate-CoA ligase